MTHDGDYRLFSIAFAIGETENYETWLWFLANLNEALGLFMANMTFVSNRQKELVEAIKGHHPNA